MSLIFQMLVVQVVILLSKMVITAITEIAITAEIYETKHHFIARTPVLGNT